MIDRQDGRRIDLDQHLAGGNGGTGKETVFRTHVTTPSWTRMKIDVAHHWNTTGKEHILWEENRPEKKLELSRSDKEFQTSCLEIFLIIGENTKCVSPIIYMNVYSSEVVNHVAYKQP